MGSGVYERLGEMFSVVRDLNGFLTAIVIPPADLNQRQNELNSYARQNSCIPAGNSRKKPFLPSDFKYRTTSKISVPAAL